MSEQNKQLVRRFFEQIDTGEPAILDEFVGRSTTITTHRPSLTSRPESTARARRSTSRSTASPTSSTKSWIRWQRVTR